MERKVMKLFGGKIWPWLAAWGVLAITAFVTTKIYPEPHPGYMCYLIAPVVLLFAGLAVYAAVCSRKNTEERFADVFHRVFHRYWVYYLLFVLASCVINIVWTSIVGSILGFGGVNFLSDIIPVTVVGPFKEEAMYRLLPFMVAIIPLAVVKDRRWRIVLYCLAAVLIFCVQMQFGFLHLDILNMSGNDRISIHLWVQGGCGVLFAATFGAVLYYTYRYIMARQKAPNKHRAVLLSIPAAFLASYIVHGIGNLYLVFSQLF